MHLLFGSLSFIRLWCDPSLYLSLHINAWQACVYLYESINWPNAELHRPIEYSYIDVDWLAQCHRFGQRVCVWWLLPIATMAYY